MACGTLHLRFQPTPILETLGRMGLARALLLRFIDKIDFPSRGTIQTKKNLSWPVGLGNVY